eukprot:CAMPEP_0173094526 /NCGR_PEP_ID=MMETSP1102-20130122/31074_1 /TAXON_ID=49646 /ORGANISM="Geminigera sp., Strain Caron Lab Isolate" /LENGTH=62 /DNA_ID=CAMNT_0013983621 /DNA_START=39 /DNA_END=227 /DNA_ORIENTATION=+
MFQVLSFTSYLDGPMKNWSAHSGGIHPAMPVSHQEGETTDLAQRQGHSVVKAEDNTNQSKYW